MTPKRRTLNLSVIFACLCFSKSLLIIRLLVFKMNPFEPYHDFSFPQCVITVFVLHA